MTNLEKLAKRIDVSWKTLNDRHLDVSMKELAEMMDDQSTIKIMEEMRGRSNGSGNSSVN